MPALSARIDALEKHAPDFRQQFMGDLMQHVSIHRIDEAINDGLPGVRALLAEVYGLKANKSGNEAADAWVLRLKQNIPRFVKRGG